MGKNQRPGFESALRRKLGTVAPPADSCPDDDRLAAYLEKRLPPLERAAVEDHASRCTACQEVLAVALGLADGAPAAAAAPDAGRPERPALFGLSFSLAAAGLMVLAVGLGVVLIRDRWRGGGPPASMVRLEGRAREAPAAPLPAPKPQPEEPPAPRSDEATSRTTPPGAESEFRAAAAGGKAKEETAREAGDVKISGVPPASAPAPAATVDAVAPFASAAREHDQTAIVAAEEATRFGKLANAGAAGRPDAHVAVHVSDDERAGERKRARDQAAETSLAAESARPPAKVAVKDARLAAPGGPRQAIGALSARLAARAQLQVRTEQAGGLVGKTSGGKLAGVARQQADTPGRAGVDMPARAVGARTFFLVAGYWIDAEVAEHPQAELVEITSRGTEGNEIRKALPEVEGLAREAAGGQAGTPIVHWQGRNCVVR